MTRRVATTDTQSGPKSSESTSTTLLQGVKTQNPEAWRRLVDIYTPLIYRWCRQAGLAAEDARDVGQEVFRAVVSNVEQFRRERPTDSFRGWLWTITRHKICDHLRRRQGDVPAEGGTDAQQRLAQLPDIPPPDDSQTSSSDDQIALTNRALLTIRDGFEDHTWQAFWRTTVGRERGTDVAADLGMSVQAVYQAKYRVLQRVRKELSDILG